MEIGSQPIKAVIFDLDDTLYREYNYVHFALGNVARYLGLKYEADIQLLFCEMMKELKTKGRGRIFDDVCIQHGWKENIADLVAVYRSTQTKLSLYPDADSFMQKLEKQGIPTGIITDGNAVVQQNKIDGLKLADRVKEIILTDTLGEGYAKPSTKPFLEMLSRFDCTPEHAVYIGDNPQKDFIGAKEIGMHTVRIIRLQGDHMKDIEDEAHRADMTIHSLMEL